MDGCKGIIRGEEYKEFIVAFSGNLTQIRSRYSPDCIQVINNKYVAIYKKEGEMSISEYGYYEVPKVYGLLNTSKVAGAKWENKNLLYNMELPVLGENVIIGFIDSGYLGSDGGIRTIPTGLSLWY